MNCKIAWIYVSLCILPLLLVVSLCSFMMPYKRIKSINAYNERANIWIKQGIPKFDTAGFEIRGLHSGKVMPKSTYAPGIGYPFRDLCIDEGDPECKITPALFYETSIVVDHMYPNHTFVDREKNIVLEDSYVFEKVKFENSDDLSCKYQFSECPARCAEKDGEWDSETKLCKVTYYLNDVCYRVSYNTTWEADTKNTVLENNPSHDIGCEYSNNWSPYSYSTHRSGFVKIQIRSYEDSLIAASSITHGCSDGITITNHCFGTSKKDIDKIRMSVNSVIFYALLLEIIGMAVYLKNKSNEEKIAIDITQPLITTQTA